MTSKQNPTEIKSAYIIDNQLFESATSNSSDDVKPSVSVEQIEDLADIDRDERQAAAPSYASEVNQQKPRKAKKWFGLFAALVTVAAVAELGYFLIELTHTLDWLGGLWLEWRGLASLKRQQTNRKQSQQLFDTPAIGSAIDHCNLIAENLTEPDQHHVEQWRQQLRPTYTDSEVIALFEKQALSPLDDKALRVIKQNASAAGVMIALSPFALLDMLIVVWRNIRMINQVSEVYGVNLGYWGRVKLVRNVFRTMVYAGAAEIASDAGTYALGAGITGKLSTSLAQGLGASVLTARIGLRAVTESRPMPFLSVAKPNLTSISKQLMADLTKRVR
jgi:putative membrane protein